MSETATKTPVLGSAHLSSRSPSLPPLPLCEKLTESVKASLRSEECLFSVGIIADPQYADVDDRYNYTRTSVRHYRDGLSQIKRAVECWNTACELGPLPSMAICMGDVIDGLNFFDSPSTRIHSVSAMDAVMDAFAGFHAFEKDSASDSEKDTERKSAESSDCGLKSAGFSHESWFDEGSAMRKLTAVARYPFFHNVIGNHEVYNFNRSELQSYFVSPKRDSFADESGERFEQGETFYYSMSPFAGFRFLFLDAYCVSKFGWTHRESHVHSTVRSAFLGADDCDDVVEWWQVAAARRLLAVNRNADQNSHAGLRGDSRRFVEYGGGFGDAQIAWIEAELKQATAKGENVFVFAHLALNCESPDENILAFDYDKVRALFDAHSGVLQLVCAGHDHGGERTQDPNGIWFRTLEGAVEATENCFCTAFFYKDKVLVHGYGGHIADEVYHFVPAQSLC